MASEIVEQVITPEQLAVVERARGVRVTPTRIRKRAPGHAKWTFKPRIVLSRDMDVVKLLGREQGDEITNQVTETRQ